MEPKGVPGTLGRALLTLCVCALSASCAVLEEKVCHGTHMGFAEPSNPDANFQEMRDRYTGCTFVQGNLELTWMRSENLDLSFLRHIREVTGYVLLFNVGVRRVPLTNLQIIRGEKLLKTTAQREAFAFLATTVTTQYLEMPALREIRRGCVGFLQSYNLCNIKNIEWKYINQNWRSNIFDITDSDTECLPCDSSCNGECWGPGPQNCQKVNVLRCHSECSGRCFGEGYTECCHSYCAIGCNSTQPNDCIACKHYDNDGTCVVSCPRGKYKYGAACVRTCPEPMLKDNDACVSVCPPGKRVVQGECIPCQGLCHKVCEGVDLIHSGNVNSFRNCTTIQGSLEIKDITFTGFQKFHSNFIPGPLYEEMHPDALEVFNTVKEITGHLSISGSHPAFTDLSFLRSLDIIRGDILAEHQAALSIEKTSLKTLGLRSLSTVSKGGIFIQENKDLCLLQQNNWNEIKRSPMYSIRIQGNRPENECAGDGYNCHLQCSSQGCWGTLANECFSCANYKLKDQCIGQCQNSSGSAGIKSYDEDEVCFTNAFLPGLSLYIINENTKELVGGHSWDDSLNHAYVTTHRQYQIWMQHLSGHDESADQANDLKNCPNRQLNWVDAANGAIPNGGFLGGTDPKCMLYVGRTNHDGELLPGKICPRYNSIYVAWKGGEHLYNGYQVLTGSNFEWILASGTQIPSCAVEAGRLKDGTPVYVGRTYNAGALDIGRVNPVDGLLYIPYYGQEYSFRAYEILVFKSKKTSDQESQDRYLNRCPGFNAQWEDVPTGNFSREGFVSTNDSKCNHYVGRTTHEGDLIPGKFFYDNRALYISWGGQEFTYNEFQVLKGHNYEWIPATRGKIPACAVQGGHTADGTPLYIGKANHNNDCAEIGKVNPVDGLLYFGYFSKEYTYTEYDILVFKTV